MSSKRKLEFETYTAIRPSVEMLAKIQTLIEEYCDREFEKVVREIVTEKKLKEIVKECLEEKKHAEKETVYLKKIPMKKATDQVKAYIDEHQGCLTSDIIFDLKLAPDLILKVLRKLEKQEKVRGERLES